LAGGAAQTFTLFTKEEVVRLRKIIVIKRSTHSSPKAKRRHCRAEVLKNPGESEKSDEIICE
jgi:hypothetical protein